MPFFRLYGIQSGNRQQVQAVFTITQGTRIYFSPILLLNDLFMLLCSACENAFYALIVSAQEWRCRKNCATVGSLYTCRKNRLHTVNHSGNGYIFEL